MACEFEDDVINELLQRTEKGEPLTVLCDDVRMPGRRTVYDWIDAKGERFDKDFAARFHSARARGIHALAEQCLAIADEKSQDAVAATDKRIRIDTRLRLAGKWLPAIYGDKVAHIGGDPSDPAIRVETLTRTVVDPA